MQRAYEDRDVLITGGLGFIGSSLAHRLVALGANVVLLDSLHPAYGGDRANVRDIEDEVRTVIGDVTDEATVGDVVEGKDYVFHLAAQLSRTKSMENPVFDTTTNCTGTLTVLEAVRTRAPDATVVFTGSQASFGVPESLPISETTADNPVDVYGANKRAAESYLDVYNRAHGIETATARLSNVYGPRMQLSNPNYGVIGRFLNLAMSDEKLPVFKPGTMLRDPIFVADAVEALLRLARQSHDRPETFVVASGESISVREMAETIVSVVDRGTVVMKEWPADWDTIRVGDLEFDIGKAKRELDWTPKTSFSEGIAETIRFIERRER